jgi:hypothetical protein
MIILKRNHTRRRLIGAMTAVVSILSASWAISQIDKVDPSFKYVAEGRDVKSFDGNALKNISVAGRLLLGGSFSTNDKRAQWTACASPDGRLLWSVQMPEEVGAGSAFLTTDGESIWTGMMKNNGTLRFGKFEGKTSRKEKAVQLVLEPVLTGANFQLHSETGSDFDLQISSVQCLHNSVGVALFSRDFSPIFNNVYSVPNGDITCAGDAASTYLVRIPDRTGYYLFFKRPPLAGDKSGTGIAILRLDNNGAIKWANTYSFGSPDLDVGPRVTSDGSILIHLVDGFPHSVRSIFLKIGTDGAVNWAETIEELTVAITDFYFNWYPYRFTTPYLLANGVQIDSRGRAFTVLFAIDYQTGKIVKQIKFGGDSAGVCGFIEKTGESFYVSFLNATILSSGPVSQVAILRFDFDLNLRGARGIRNGEAHFPFFQILPSGKGLISYAYNEKRTLLAEMVDANLEGADPCEFLEKKRFSFTKASFQTRPLTVQRAALTALVVPAGNIKSSEVDMELPRFELTAAPCDAKVRALSKESDH